MGWDENRCNACASAGITCIPIDVTEQRYDDDGKPHLPDRYVRKVVVDGIPSGCISTESARKCRRFRDRGAVRVIVDGKLVTDLAMTKRAWYVDFIMGLSDMAKRADLFNWSAGGNPAFRVRWASDFVRDAMRFVVGEEVGWGNRAVVAAAGLGVLTLIAQQGGFDISTMVGSVVEAVSAASATEQLRTCVTMLTPDPVQALNALNYALTGLGKAPVSNFDMVVTADRLYQVCTMPR